MQASPWFVNRNSLGDDVLASVRRLMNLDVGRQTHDADIVWGSPVGHVDNGLALTGLADMQNMPLDHPLIPQVFEEEPFAGLLLEEARRIRKQLGAVWALTGMLARKDATGETGATDAADAAGESGTTDAADAAGESGTTDETEAHSTAYLLIRRTESISADAACSLASLLETLGAPAPCGDASGIAAKMDALGLSYDVLLGLDTSDAKPNGSLGLSLNWNVHTDPTVIEAILAELQERGLADSRVQICRALTVRQAIKAIDSQNVEFETFMLSLPSGVELMWDAAGNALESAWLQEISARIV